MEETLAVINSHPERHEVDVVHHPENLAEPICLDGRCLIVGHGTTTGTPCGFLTIPEKRLKPYSFRGEPELHVNLQGSSTMARPLEGGCGEMTDNLKRGPLSVSQPLVGQEAAVAAWAPHAGAPMRAARAWCVEIGKRGVPGGFP